MLKMRNNFDKYVLNFLFPKIFDSFLFLITGPQAVYVNSILNAFKAWVYLPNIVIINPLASCSLIILNFWLPYTAQLDENTASPFFVFTTFEFLLSVFSLHLKQ